MPQTMTSRLFCAALALGLLGTPFFSVHVQAQANSLSFDAEKHPPAPDYSDAASWAVIPGHPNLSQEVPAGVAPPTPSSAVDVFYIQPTTLNGSGPWNQHIDDLETNAWTDVSVVARQATIFNACCRIFVPRYRQARLGSSITEGTDGYRAYDLAYQDVKRAFDYYLSHYNHGRPFILAGHSQGAFHIYRLIEEEIDGKPLQKQLVAAYAIGVPTYVGAFGRTYKTVMPCLKPFQTGCLASWNSFLNGFDPSTYIALSQAFYVKRYPGAPGKELFCINPLTFNADQPAASAAFDAGSMTWPPVVGPLPPLVPHAVSATCRNGILMIDPAPEVGFKPFMFPGGSLHMQDLDLFYLAIRNNAVARAQSYLAQKAHNP